jgi:hypothetical protein
MNVARKPDDEKKRFKQILQKDPRNIEAHLGLAQTAEDDSKKAEHHNKAVELIEEQVSKLAVKKSMMENAGMNMEMLKEQAREALQEFGEDSSFKIRLAALEEVEDVLPETRPEQWLLLALNPVDIESFMQSDPEIEELDAYMEAVRKRFSLLGRLTGGILYKMPEPPDCVKSRLRKYKDEMRSKSTDEILKILDETGELFKQYKKEEKELASHQYDLLAEGLIEEIRGKLALERISDWDEINDLKKNCSLLEKYARKNPLSEAVRNKVKEVLGKEFNEKRRKDRELISLTPESEEDYKLRELLTAWGDSPPDYVSHVKESDFPDISQLRNRGATLDECMDLLRKYEKQVGTPYTHYKGKTLGVFEYMLLTKIAGDAKVKLEDFQITGNFSVFGPDKLEVKIEDDHITGLKVNGELENLQYFGCFPELREVYVSGCNKLSNIDALDKLENLKRVEIEGTAVSPDNPMIKKLQEKGIEVKYEDKLADFFGE